MPKDDSITPIDANIVHYKELNVVGAYGSNYWQHVTALNLIADGKIDVRKIITEVYSLDDINKAFENIIKGNSLKIVIKP
ncbi:hypothetical protein DXT63_16995 [Thermoanaerobacteraceae bacterium SP2]|nr:hypothetical protein DXT63_16995 [Thermoanaerobacteraceae bacterium SP2]